MLDRVLYLLSLRYTRNSLDTAKPVLNELRHYNWMLYIIESCIWQITGNFDHKVSCCNTHYGFSISIKKSNHHTMGSKHRLSV